MNRTRAVLQPASVRVQKKEFYLLLYSPPPPIQRWRVTQQFPTKTIQFCTTLNRGEGGEAMKTSKIRTFPTVLSMIVVLVCVVSEI